MATQTIVVPKVDVELLKKQISVLAEAASEANPGPLVEVLEGVENLLSEMIHLGQLQGDKARREPEQRGRDTLQPSKYEKSEQQARDENYSRADDFYRRQHEDHTKASDLAQAIGSYLNRGGDLQMLAQEISRHEHRTLQQRFMGVVMAFIADEAMLGGAGFYDLRNQATCAIAQQIMDLFDEDADLVQHLPFI